MIDHVGLRTTQPEIMIAFYKAALAPLGYKVMMEYPDTAGFGRDWPDFWIGRSDNASRIHLALRTEDRKVVDAFHAAALANGGTDNGGPGKREYTPTYYAAFVIDPDGNNLEVVCHEAG